MSARTITWLLATRQSSPFYARRHVAVVPNVSWGLLPWEADVLVCTKAGYLQEVEVKISLSDWKADANKWKFKGTGFSERIRAFWYAVPPKLAQRHAEAGIPEWAGVVAVDDDGVKVIRKAGYRKTARKLRDDEILQLLRLGAIKAWKRLDPNTLKSEMKKLDDESVSESTQQETHEE